MILNSLVDYYQALADRNEIAQLEWCLDKVSFALNISYEGKLLGIITQKHTERRGKKEFEVPDQVYVPERVIRASGIKANFLCDNTSYLLGFDDKGKAERSLDCFEASKALHLEVLKDCTQPIAVAIKSFFMDWQPKLAMENEIIKPYLSDMVTANLIFRVEGDKYAQQDPEICQAWQKYQNADSDVEKERCLVTGETETITRLHGKIKGVNGAQSAGANLISFNACAYESYGKENGIQPVVPIGKYAAFAYVTAVNHLLADREHVRQIGDTSVVYWAEKADEKAQNMFSIFAFPKPDDDSLLDGVMKNLAAGKPIDEVDISNRFYILGLAPNAARISVRYFLQDSFKNMIDNIRLHYERLEIIKPNYDLREYLSVPALLNETVNPHSKDKSASPLLSGSVMRSILTNSRYPEALFNAVITRIRAEREVSRGKAAIIKAYLIKNKNEKEVATMALNKESNNKAYVLGRLFAVLEDAQMQANPGIKSTIKDRFFTSACATPGSVFPQILKLSNFHTAKAEYGMYKEKEKAELLYKLDIETDPLPTHLSLQEQGIFILGYYHQTQARYSKKEEKENECN